MTHSHTPLLADAAPLIFQKRLFDIDAYVDNAISILASSTSDQSKYV